jgi:chitodextrinase
VVWELDGYAAGPALGRDAAGTTVLARDEATGTEVAIRFLSAALCASPEFMWRFRADVVQLEVIEAPNTAQVYELIERDGQVALVTQLIQGPSLREVLRRGTLPPDAALYVMAGVLNGLAALHSRDILHRALRADTVLVDPHGTIKLIDVGLAGPGAPPTNAAPELRDGGPASISSDVYAAYLLLLECVARVSHPRDEAGVPAALQVAINVGLAEHPGARYPDALTALDQLQLVARGMLGPDWYAQGRDALLRHISGPVAPLPGPAELPRRVSTAVPAIPIYSDTPPAPPPVRPRTPTAALPAWAELTEPTVRLQPAPPEQHDVLSGRSEQRHTRRALRLLVATTALVVFAGGTGWAVVSRLSPAPDASTAAATNSHVPTVAGAGPTVPATARPGVSLDTSVPATPAGLHVTGRSQTSVSLDWAASMDNTRVAGYILTRNGKQIGTTHDPGYTDTGLTAMTRYQYTVAAFDDAGNISPGSAPVVAITLAEPDRFPPTIPAGLHVTGKSVTSVVLAWTASRDNVGVAGYEVYRDGALVADVGQPSFTDTGLAPASTHTYRVRAFDTSNNASADSAATTATTLAAPDTTPPSTPIGLGAIGTSSTTIDISWHTASDNIGVTGYRLFRDGVQVALVPTTAYTDQGLTPATSYTYTVQALDAAGNSSALSAPASASTAPTPTTPDPTTIPPTTNPAPQIMSVTLTETVNGCQISLDATVTATGPMNATLSYTYTVGGVSGTIPLAFTAGNLSWTGSLPSPDTSSDGTATADAGGKSDTAGWTACPPDPPTTGESGSTAPSA